MRTLLRLLSGGVLLAACTDSPVSLPDAPLRTEAVIPTPEVPCTSRWAAAVNGSWFDVARWIPAGVPGSTASVCIDLPGTYTVTMDPANDAIPIQIAALALGAAGASPNLLMTGQNTTLQVTQGVVVRAGATLTMNNFGVSAVTVGGTLTNRGTLAALPTCAQCSHALSANVLNEGTMNVLGTLTLTRAAVAYQNLGTLNLGSNGRMVVPAGAGAATFEQDGGAITASGNFATLTMRSGTFTVRGGKVRTRSGASNPRPIVVLDGANLVLGAQATDSVAVAVRGGSAAAPTISGNVPALTALWLAGTSDGQPGTVSFAGNVSNAGQILPYRDLDATSGALTLAGSGRLTNAGTIAHTLNGGTGAVFRYALDVTNDGTWSATDGTHIWLTGAGRSYQNHGTVNLGAQSGTSQLVVPIGVTLVNGASGTIGGGTVLVDGGRFLGTGTLTTTLRPSNGGVVEPGASPGLLTTYAYSPTGTGRLRIELGGLDPVTGYDQLRATSVIQLAQSTLDVVEIDGFVSGLCGQVFTIVTHATGGAANSWGPFGTVNGLTPGSGRALRIVYQSQVGAQPGTIQLVGFDGSRKICVGPETVSVVEGGATATYAVTLAQAPTLPVTVNLSPDAQVTASPASLTFTSANWQIPQLVTVAAVDDQIPEGGHTGSVSHSVTTTDPFYQGTAIGSVAANITDNDTNRPPVAVNDVGSTAEDTAVEIPVLGNDSDPDGDPVRVTSVTAPGHGSAVVIDNGAAVRYTPAPNYNGSDAFTYTISDGRGGSASASVAVNISAVPDVPIAANDEAETTPSTPVTISVLANDSDPDGDPITVVSVTQPANGSAQIAPGGQAVTYQPGVSFTSGADVFSYTIGDGTGRTATASVTVQVRVPPPPPVAPDLYETAPNRGVVVYVPLNQFDPVNRLNLVAVTQPSHGRATIMFNIGGIRYDSDGTGFLGIDQFTYTVEDPRGARATGNVFIYVTAAGNWAPVPLNDSASTSEDRAVAILVLENDFDRDNEPIFVAQVGAPANGTATIQNGRLSVLYTPNPNFHGQDRFTYVISDGTAKSFSATVFVTVTPVNDAPVAVDDQAQTVSPTPVVIPVLANDTDVDGDVLLVTSVSPPDRGTAAVSGGGQTVTYTPPAGFQGLAVFRYSIGDGKGGTGSATVRVAVGSNRAPVAVADNAQAIVGGPDVRIAALSNDSDADGDPLRILSVTPPLRGTVRVDAAGAQLLYTPGCHPYSGSQSFQDRFNYTVGDGRGGTATAGVTVTVLSPASPGGFADDLCVAIAASAGPWSQVGRQQGAQVVADVKVARTTRFGQSVSGQVVIDLPWNASTYTLLADGARSGVQRQCTVDRARPTRCVIALPSNAVNQTLTYRFSEDVRTQGQYAFRAELQSGGSRPQPYADPYAGNNAAAATLEVPQ